MITRRRTRQITLGSLKIGGDAPLTVQSMTKTDTRDVQATLLEIWALEAAGCDIVRCAVPVREAAEKLGEIKKQIRIPLVADIHFNYKLALIALDDAGYAARWPDELSGGERQRVGVARALAADPPVLLMDEPFGALDPVTRRQLQDEFRRIQAQLHKTVLLVTHDMAEAMTLADRIGVLEGGRLIWLGPADEIAASDDPRVRQFVETASPRRHGSTPA